MRTRILSCLLAVLVLESLGLMSCGKDDDGWASKNIADRAGQLLSVGVEFL